MLLALRVFFLLLFVRHHGGLKLLFAPDRVYYPKRVVVLQAREYKLFESIMLEPEASQSDAVLRGLFKPGDRAEGNCYFFEHAEHVGDEHDVLLADIEAAEVGDLVLVGAAVVLEDGLALNPQVLAYYFAARLAQQQLASRFAQHMQFYYYIRLLEL